MLKDTNKGDLRELPEELILEFSPDSKAIQLKSLLENSDVYINRKIL